MITQYYCKHGWLLLLAACSERTEPMVTHLYAEAPAIGGTALQLPATLGARIAQPALDRMITHLEAAAPDSVVRLGTRIVSHNFARGDTVLYHYFRGDTLLLSRRRVQLADTSQAPAPPYGQAATYKGCAVIERGGRGSGVKSGSMCWLWAYTRPLPPPTLDSVIRIARIVVLPANAEVVAREAGHAVSEKNQVQLCPFAVLSDGRKVKLKNAWNVPGCDAAYKSWVTGELALNAVKG